MELTATRFGSEQPSTDTLVVSHYPVGGNDLNTGPRYRTEARITGFDILGITRVGTNTLLPDPRLRRRLSQHLFDEMCEEIAHALRPMCSGYKYLILRGQSTGAFPTLGIARSKVLPVTHLLVEDGINTRRSRRGSVRDPLTARIDWLRHRRNEISQMGQPPREHWATPEKLPTSWRTVAQFAVEQYHWAPLWRSRYGRDSILRIAQDQPDLPILVKCLGHTALTTRREVAELRQDLTRIRDGGRSAECRVDLDDEGWHGWLVYAEYGAGNLLAARAMLG